MSTMIEHGGSRVTLRCPELVELVGIEPTASSTPKRRSPAELQPHGPAMRRPDYTGSWTAEQRLPTAWPGCPALESTVPAPTAHAGSRARIARKLDDGGVAPQPLEVVVLPLRRREDVDDDVAKIQQDPPPLLAALGAPRPLAGRPQRLLHRLGDRFDLDPIGAAGDDEEIRDRSVLLDVQHDDALRKLGLGGGRRQERLATSLHYAPRG